MKGYLLTYKKNECYGCEACVLVCQKHAISIKEDNEGFRYPKIDKNKCINCNLCHNICPVENPAIKNNQLQSCYGGYIKDKKILEESTSGGLFSAIVSSFCDTNYVIFGAESNGLDVFHSYTFDKSDIYKYRKSKYSQSIIGDSYKKVREFLNKGMKVLFSGTPCQIAALYKFLSKTNINKLLTVEIICEGTPSPLYIKKYEDYLFNKYKSKIKTIDYRHKSNGYNWDFQIMKIVLENNKEIKKDRWFNPYWKLWLEHLMSRPSCYDCTFATKERCADITLGDLWGVHIYCPELYNFNKGASLLIANNHKGASLVDKIKSICVLKSLDLNEAIKYQSPLRKTISSNKNRKEFISDLVDPNMNYISINKKWYKSNNVIMFIKKYIIDRIIKTSRFICKRGRI